VTNASFKSHSESGAAHLDWILLLAQLTQPGSPMKKTSLLSLSFLSAIAMLLSLSSASATVLPPGLSGPPDFFTPIPGGTLLASSNSGTVTSTNGLITFDVVTAVYSDPTNVFGAGDLSFVYQVMNSANSVDGISRLTAINFTGFLTDVGVTTMGASIPGGLFVNGLSQLPQTVDRSIGGDTIGFNYPIPFNILPGQTSLAMIIETNATAFKPGFFNIIDGGVSTVNAFAPTTPAVPESGSTAILLSLSMVGLLVGYTALARRSVA